MPPVGRTTQTPVTSNVGKTQQTLPTAQTSAPKNTTPAQAKTTAPPGDQFKATTSRSGATANLTGGTQQQTPLPRQAPSPDKYVQMNGLGGLSDKMKISSYVEDNLKQPLKDAQVAATPQEKASMDAAKAQIAANKGDWNAAKPHLETLAQHSNTINQRIANQKNGTFDTNTPYGRQGLTDFMKQHSASNASDANISQVLNQAQDGGGKATGTKQDGKLTSQGQDVLHASAGKKDAAGGATLFYTQPAPGQIKPVAVGQHATGTSYDLLWKEPGFQDGKSKLQLG